MASLLLRNVLSRIRDADCTYALLEENDRIILPLSGSEDSLGLLYALSFYCRYRKKKYRLFPVFLDIGYPNEDLSDLKKWVEDLGFSLLNVDAKFIYPTLLSRQKEGKKLSRSLYSKLYKNAIKDVACSLKANKIAFSSTHDEAVEALFNNVFENGRFATITPKLHWQGTKIDLIRPLILCEQSQLQKLAEDFSFPCFHSSLPLSKAEYRIPDSLTHEESARKNLRKALSNGEEFELYFDNLEFFLERDPSYTLKPIFSAKDMRGTHFASRKEKEGEKDFLLLKHHRKVGEIAYRFTSSHRVEFFALKGKEEDLYLGLMDLMDRLSKKTIPLTFLLLGARKNLALRCGFSKKKEYGSSKEKYLLKRG